MGRQWEYLRIARPTAEKWELHLRGDYSARTTTG